MKKTRTIQEEYEVCDYCEQEFEEGYSRNFQKVEDGHEVYHNKCVDEMEYEIKFKEKYGIK